MTICLYTVVVSPHQLPLARAIVDKIGASEFRYIYTETQDADHACLNFKLANESWILHIDEPEARVWLEEKYTWQAVCKTMLSAYERVAR